VNPADAVLPYSYELEEAERCDPPFAARFEKGDQSLSFVAANHGCDPATFALIDEVFATRRVRLAVIEGYPVAQGINPPSYMRHLPEWKSGGFCHGGGEPAYTALRAGERGVAFLGGEPEEQQVAAAVLRQDFTSEDLLGFYFVRQLPQYRRDGTLQDKGLDASFTHLITVMAKQAGVQGTSSNGGFTLDRFRDWYQSRQGKPFDPEAMDDEEPAPIASGKYFTQRLSAVVGLARDRSIARLISNHLATDKELLVVYGGSHFPTLRPALEVLLGRPVERCRKAVSNPEPHDGLRRMKAPASSSAK
jgi:hypothetical protein